MTYVGLGDIQFSKASLTFGVSSVSVYPDLLLMAAFAGPSRMIRMGKEPRFSKDGVDSWTLTLGTESSVSFPQYLNHGGH